MGSVDTVTFFFAIGVSLLIFFSYAPASARSAAGASTLSNVMKRCRLGLVGSSHVLLFLLYPPSPWPSRRRDGPIDDLAQSGFFALYLSCLQSPSGCMVAHPLASSQRADLVPSRKLSTVTPPPPTAFLFFFNLDRTSRFGDLPTLLHQNFQNLFRNEVSPRSYPC